MPQGFPLLGSRSMVSQGVYVVSKPRGAQARARVAPQVATVFRSVLVRTFQIGGIVV